MRFFFPGLIFLFVSNSFFSCKQNSALFQPVNAGYSGIHFNNTISETDSLNPIDNTNLYNGGGVGIGDFNGDGLKDIYFTGNMVSNKLYVNKGSFKFEDVTAEAGVSGEGKWCRGVAVVDINNDGKQDLYVCASMDKDPERRRNLLYINQGNNEKGVPVFKEMARQYGLDDTTHSTMAAFFDYDNDGDLDMYLLVNEIVPGVNPSVFKPKVVDGSFPSTGRLYRNDRDSVTGNILFTDVSKQAGVTIEGYGHGVSVADINKDGWKDIIVANDFIANDLVYINNRNGTFTDKASSYLKHTSANGMGLDVTDINNDGLADIIELDMNPEDNYRKKMMLNPGNYRISQLNEFYRYQYQYVRNTLQLNLGPRVHAGDSTGDPVFADIGLFSGVTETDWSWAPLVADFDNDGYRDLVVTNGFPKDITDHDFIMLREQSMYVPDKSYFLSKIPEVKLHNYAFRNNGDCTFTDVSAGWGLMEASYANGAVYADLDNDGDLDIVISNINDKASVYKNTVADSKTPGKNYLSVHLTGDSLNINGLGTWIEVHYGDSLQVYEQTPYRGYLSTVQLEPYFGLKNVQTVDSVIVKWPGGVREVIKNVAANQTLRVDKKNARETYSWQTPTFAQNNLFTEISNELGIGYVHRQTDVNDFAVQKLLHHKFSEYGPSLAAGDINGDGLDDMIAGGNDVAEATAFLQQSNGTFIQKAVLPSREIKTGSFRDMGMVLLDADGDGDLDLYIARGGYESKSNAAVYQDLFLVNDGKGNFTPDTTAIPQNLTSKSCVRAADYDGDGDPDLLVAGRVDPWHFPKPVSCFIYRNDSQNGQVKFTDVTHEVAGALDRIGLVSDALFTDFDNDGWTDVLLAGEWMPLTFLKNEKGVFKNITSATGIDGQAGWWTSIVPGDFDNDGDMDYVIGNLGKNTFYKATDQYPVRIYAKDFDNNNVYDMFLSLYLPASLQDTVKKEFPVHLRDDMIRQMESMRSKFKDYQSYATATMGQVLSPEQINGALILKANNFNSGYCRNDGGGKFTLVPLPKEAQWSALNGMVADDFDGDGNLDIVINTNDYGNEITTGRYDAMNGLLLKGDGKGNFTALSILQSGIFIPANGKALVKLTGKQDRYLLAAAQNRGALKVFKLKKETVHIPLLPGEVNAELLFTDGRKQKQEFYYGSSFLSQSARFLSMHKNIKAVTITGTNGKTRTLEF
ncbi:MAG: VCBS repeat-containing protein [Chitinophagaceae bacterium]|nr:VCBS repeat-containing protein [Chitinophagaceae bacterium]